MPATAMIVALEVMIGHNSRPDWQLPALKGLFVDKYYKIRGLLYNESVNRPIP